MKSYFKVVLGFYLYVFVMLTRFLRSYAAIYFYNKTVTNNWIMLCKNQQNKKYKNVGLIAYSCSRSGPSKLRLTSTNQNQATRF